MKPRHTNSLLRLGAFAAILFSSLVLFSFRMRSAADDLWAQLGLSKLKAEENIKASFLNGYLHYYGAKSAKNIALGNRGAVAKDLMEYSKQQLASESFRKEYEKIRASAKPVEYPYVPKEKEALRKEKIAELQKSIKDAEELVKKMPEMEKTMRSTIDLFKQNVKDYADPNNEMIELFYQNELSIKSQREKTYADNMERWNEEYPAELKVLVKKRLQHFVSLAKTVDFNAQLKEVGGKKKFVNPKYEGQSTEWKQVFRAGKEVVQPAIGFAEQWIKELN